MGEFCTKCNKESDVMAVRVNQTVNGKPFNNICMCWDCMKKFMEDAIHMRDKLEEDDIPITTITGVYLTGDIDSKDVAKWLKEKQHADK